MPRTVIIGAGQAGLQIAESLRKGGYVGEIVLLGEEAAPPYQRPPLSKKYLAGDFAEERLQFRPPAHYAKLDIELRCGVRVLAVERERRLLHLGHGDTLAYDALALTTGARVRRLSVPGGEHPVVCYLRGVDDARELKARLAVARRVVVVGGGFIGLEVAATARHAGCEVHVVEAQDRLMARVMPAVLSEFFAGLHRGHGVALHLGAQFAAIEDCAGGASVRLATGDTLGADVVVAGIGVVPNQELAAAAGLDCGNGIVVDEFARTSDPAIVAAGDCTWHRNRLFEAPQRLESVQNAVDQAKIAAATLLGARQAYAEVPWFWSDQFEVKLQTTGLSGGADAHVLRGTPSNAGFSVYHFAGERLVAVDSVNRPADHMLARRLLAAGTPVSRVQAADTAFELKTLLGAA
jgi:3-phenylpropionate/trans-cinnamate dioxygenase ferredoxin reductase subunit